MAEVVQFNPKPSKGALGEDSELSFVPMAAVEAGSGRMDASAVRAYGQVKKGFTYFAEGDVLFAKITPCMENGKSAVATGLRNGVGFGSTEFHVLRPTERVDARFLYHFVASASFRREAAHHMTGAVGQKRVPVDFLRQAEIPVPARAEQRRIVAEIEKQFSRLDEAVANLRRVKANLRRHARATIESVVRAASAKPALTGCVRDVAVSLDNMRKPVNKAERATRPGDIPYLGANGRTGWIDEPLFDEELVLVVEDETFVGRKEPFSYYFAGKCWVNNHTHVLRAKPSVVSPKYLNLALSYYPFIPLTTGSTGRRKLTKAALMSAPIAIPSLRDQTEIVAEVDRRLSIVRGVEAEVDANLQRAQALRQAILAKAFGTA